MDVIPDLARGVYRIVLPRVRDSPGSFVRKFDAGGVRRATV